MLFYVFISIYNSLHVSSTSCSTSGETNCINTASGNSHSMLVPEMCAGWKKAPRWSFTKYESTSSLKCRRLLLTLRYFTGSETWTGSKTSQLLRIDGAYRSSLVTQQSNTKWDTQLSNYESNKHKLYPIKLNSHSTPEKFS